MKYQFSKILKDVAIITPDIHYDYRGEYIETWNSENYAVFNYLVNDSNKIEFKQDDISTSVNHTLRGLHGDNKTWKLVSCVYGSLFQVVVDMRESSDTYLEYDMFNINDKNRNQILVPPGYANGHLVMSDFGIFSYKQSTLYKGASEQFTVKWNDPKINIPWPIDNPILSYRDKSAKLL
jgi:dTDP-4-dehydrorhamnose 3,5-epimerase|tara:strand:+ start:1207 stop:1743 length:537 start_codon:yes stop_codon:yes gene_type:complete